MSKYASMGSLYKQEAFNEAKKRQQQPMFSQPLGETRKYILKKGIGQAISNFYYVLLCSILFDGLVSAR